MTGKKSNYMGSANMVNKEAKIRDQERAAISSLGSSSKDQPLIATKRIFQGTYFVEIHFDRYPTSISNLPVEVNFHEILAGH